MVIDALIEALKGIIEVLLEFIVVMGKLVDSIILVVQNLYTSISMSVDQNNNILI